jgi:hypothetical protein
MSSRYPTPPYPMLDEKLHRILVSRGAVATCLTCRYFTDKELCTEANQRPPAEVIVFGCVRFDDIPF